MRNLLLDKVLTKSANCSTVIIGKNASATGNIILGHNEDDADSIGQLHVVPRVQHSEGETISFADAKAVIPQVSETNAFYWSEIRSKAGESFADSFVNEYGLAIVSNRNMPSKVGADGDDTGIGYGIRRLVAERAKSAREAVAIAGELVEKYGYISARCYHFVDKNEAWAFQIPTGHVYAAKRIQDDEVYYMPNWFTIHNIDFTDTEHKNFAWAENLVQNAIDNGWYTPAVENDYSDFDFAVAYQAGEKELYNLNRAREGWRKLKGIELDDEHIKPFSMKAEKKYTIADVKAILRSHSEGSKDDVTDGYRIEPHNGPTFLYTICNSWTVDSSIIEFTEDINLTRMLHASSTPCVSPYTPWYPVALTRAPEGYYWMGNNASLNSHFSVDDCDMRYDTEKTWWSIRTMQMLTVFDYKLTNKPVKDGIAKLESKWESEREGVESAYLALKDKDMDAAKEILTAYTCSQAESVKKWSNDMTLKLTEIKMRDNAKEFE